MTSYIAIDNTVWLAATLMATCRNAVDAKTIADALNLAEAAETASTV